MGDASVPHPGFVLHCVLFKPSTRGQHQALLYLLPLINATSSCEAWQWWRMFSPVSVTLMPPHSTLNTFLSRLQPWAVVHFKISLKMSPSGALSEPLTSIPVKASDFIKQTARAQQLSVSQLEKMSPPGARSCRRMCRPGHLIRFSLCKQKNSLSEANTRHRLLGENRSCLFSLLLSRL